MIPGVIIIEGHVQGLSNTRALGEVGIPVIVIDMSNCLARYSRYCRKFFYCPEFDSPDLIDFLIKLSINENLKGWILMPSNDHIIENISKNKSEIDKYYKTIVPPISQLEKILNKKELLLIASKINLPVPKTFDIKNYRESIKDMNFPVLIKGLKGLSFFKKIHAKAILANSNEEVLDFIASAEKREIAESIIIQELIPYDPNHKVVSFTSFCINGEIKSFWIGLKIREHPIKYGTATLAMSIYNDPCYKQSFTLLKELDYTGVCEIEYLFDPRDNQYKLIEINPRTWLWVGLAKSCGVNYALYIYNYLNNLPIEFPKDYDKDIKWINYVTDSVFSLKSLFKGYLSLKEYFITMKGKKINAVFSWKDIMPGILFPFMIFYISKKRV